MPSRLSLAALVTGFVLATAASPCLAQATPQAAGQPGAAPPADVQNQILDSTRRTTELAIDRTEKFAAEAMKRTEMVAAQAVASAKTSNEVMKDVFVWIAGFLGVLGFGVFYFMGQRYQETMASIESKFTAELQEKSGNIEARFTQDLQQKSRDLEVQLRDLLAARFEDIRAGLHAQTETVTAMTVNISQVTGQVGAILAAGIEAEQLAGRSAQDAKVLRTARVAAQKAKAEEVADGLITTLTSIENDAKALRLPRIEGWAEMQRGHLADYREDYETALQIYLAQLRRLESEQAAPEDQLNLTRRKDDRRYAIAVVAAKTAATRPERVSLYKQMLAQIETAQFASSALKDDVLMAVLDEDVTLKAQLTARASLPA